MATALRGRDDDIIKKAGSEDEVYSLVVFHSSYAQFIINYKNEKVK